MEPKERFAVAGLIAVALMLTLAWQASYAGPLRDRIAERPAAAQQAIPFSPASIPK